MNWRLGMAIGATLAVRRLWSDDGDRRAAPNSAAIFQAGKRQRCALCDANAIEASRTRNGTFKYLAGETVTFSVGGIQLGHGAGVVGDHSVHAGRHDAAHHGTGVAARARSGVAHHQPFRARHQHDATAAGARCGSQSRQWHRCARPRCRAGQRHGGFRSDDSPIRGEARQTHARPHAQHAALAAGRSFVSRRWASAVPAHATSAVRLRGRLPVASTRRTPSTLTTPTDRWNHMEARSMIWVATPRSVCVSL